jgi:hypothetical protein
MIHQQLLILILSFASISLCQGQQLKSHRLVDRHCKDCTEMKFGPQAFELKDIRDSKEKVEIRFLVNNEHCCRSYTVIKGSPGKFTAAYYFQQTDHFTYTEGPDSAKGLKPWKERPFVRFKVDSINLDSIVIKLTANGIYELPPQRELVPNDGYYSQYVVETKLKGIVRKYNFGNLREFIARYPDIPEFKSYKAIASIFENISVAYITEISLLKSR